jgi:hypothetical protein
VQLAPKEQHSVGQPGWSVAFRILNVVALLAPISPPAAPPKLAQ